MGYSTDFAGELTFTREPTATELAFVTSLFWTNDADIHNRGLRNSKGKLSYIQFELTDNFGGIKWDGSEKFYNAIEAVNFLIENMRFACNGLGLTGSLLAQGEEFEDRWYLVIGDDGWAKRVDHPMVGQTITCPHCGENFAVEAA